MKGKNSQVFGVLRLKKLAKPRRVYTSLLVAALVAGAAQAPLLSFTHNLFFKWVDDLPVLIFLLVGWISSFFFRGKRERLAAALLTALGLYVAVWLAFSPSFDVGVSQARQVLIPIGLAAIGYSVCRDINWRILLYWCLGVALVTALWVFAEGLLQAPLLDPNWNYLALGASQESLRQGIPPSYYADGVFGQTVFRPGGPFMNPPTAGFVLGLGGLAARFLIRSLYVRWALYVTIAGALGLTFARAGMLIFICSLLLPWAWAKFSRKVTLVAGGIAAIAVALVFLPQGGTASHASGLFVGLKEGFGHIFGHGFGQYGYQAALTSGDSTTVGESLLGLYAVWLGWPILALLAWAVWRLARLIWNQAHSGAAAQWAAIGMLSAAAFSETASALSGTVVLWVIVGASLRSDLYDKCLWAPSR